MARMAHGLADDLATAVLLATRAPILLAPAMNPAMWSHRATRRNLEALVADGARIIGPNAGEMAESNEAGVGRMAEPIEIADAALALLEARSGALAGKRVLVTSGPTHEPIDPVRYIANRSSGKQGHAIAAAAAQAGAQVTLVSGPVNVPAPSGVTVVKVESAREMLRAVEAALPADVAVFAAAVADWRTADVASNKLKKDRTTGAPALSLVENPDILATIAHRKRGRPTLVIGFAAETQDLVENAKKKLERKGCDWIVANDVSTETGVMGGDVNTVQIVTANGVEAWPPQGKDAVAAALIARIARTLGGGVS
jgi:phosphopantothenoylcysteine decarboxylase/phosphopantothenate--cysteine ligase